MKQFIFLGPCDRLRMAGGEEHWQQMMLEKAPISIDQFARDCDLLTLLEDDETLEDFIGIFEMFSKLLESSSKMLEL